MRFMDSGYWVRRGVEIFDAVRALDFERDGDSLSFFASIKGPTLNDPVLEVRLSSPAEGVVRVRYCHFSGKAVDEPRFVPWAEDRCCTETAIGDGFASIKTGALEARVSAGNEWRIDFYREGGKLTGCGAQGTAYVLDQGKPCMKEELSLAVGECVYGFGERFTSFVKNGQTVEAWNTDAGTGSDGAYKTMPFYISNRGYGVLVNDPGKVSFEVATEKVERVQFSAPGESLEYFIISGPTLKDVLRRYTALTGRPALPPAWSFGLWLSTSFTTKYDEETVTGFIDGMRERDLPLHVFHFDCFWMRYYQWCDFQWDTRAFPHPEEMLARLKARGLKVSVWINPYIGQRSGLFEEGMKKGYLLKAMDGTVYQTDDWQAGMGFVDFTNPEACAWYAGHLKRLLRMGVDVFKTDFGERIPTGVLYHNGADPWKMHNYYAYLYNSTVFEAMRQERGESEAIVFARSATVGGQKFPVHWGGDSHATFESMAESLRGGLSLSLCGFGFWSHDMGGFESTASPDVYKRWLAFGMLSTHSRLHGNSSYRVPWLFDEEAVDVLRFFTKLKCRLMPYIYGAALEAAGTGVPAMRPMVLEFMDDPACDFLDRQYMLGESLLVAPVMDEDGSAAYYLPEGRWTNFLSNRVADGGRWHREKYDYFGMPLFCRPNSIIPAGADETRPDYTYSQGVELHVFELGEGCSASVRVADPDGVVRLDARAARKGNLIEVHITAASAWSMCFRNIFEAASVEGGITKQSDNGIIIQPDAGCKQVRIRLR